MPRYLHIPHTPDTARTLTLSGRNCLVVSGMVTPSLKSAAGAEKGAEAKCVHKARRSPTAGLLRALSRICASMCPTWRSLHVGMPSMYPTSRSLHLGKPLDVPHIALPARGNAPDAPHIALPACGKAPDVPHIALPACGNAPDVPHIALPAPGKAPRCTPQRTIF